MLEKFTVQKIEAFASIIEMVELMTIKPRTLCPFIINLSSWEENTANTYKLQAFFSRIENILM